MSTLRDLFLQLHQFDQVLWLYITCIPFVLMWYAILASLCFAFIAWLVRDDVQENLADARVRGDQSDVHMITLIVFMVLFLSPWFLIQIFIKRAPKKPKLAG